MVAYLKVVFRRKTSESVKKGKNYYTINAIHVFIHHVLDVNVLLAEQTVLLEELKVTFSNISIELKGIEHKKCYLF